MPRPRKLLDQILLIWSDHQWTLYFNNEETGRYARRPDAFLAARTLTERSEAQGHDCYLLERDKAGHWTEHNCPRPLKQQA